MKLFYLVLFWLSATSLWGQNQYPQYGQVPINIKWEVQNSDQRWAESKFPVLVSDTPTLILRSSFTLKSIADSLAIILTADGIQGNLSVYLNGQAVAFHPNSGADFRFRFPTSTLNPENTLVLALKQAKEHKTGFPNFTHIYSVKNFVGLKSAPEIHLEQNQPVSAFNVELGKVDKRAEVQYNYAVNLPPSKYKYRIEESFPPSTYKRIRFVSPGEHQIAGKFKTNLFNLWTPKTPVLLKANIKVVGHIKDLFSVSFPFSLRKLAQDRDRFELNNDSIQIRGINYHNDGSRFLDRDYGATIADDFKSIKQIGFNSIRLPGYIPDQIMLENADSLGLLMFAELPIKRYPKPLFFSDDLLENAKKTLNRVASLSKSHPSLVAIGIGSEISVQDAATQKFMLILNDLVHLQSGLLTYVSPIPDEPFPLEQIADFYMFNIYGPLHNYDTDKMVSPNGFLLAGKIGCVQKENAGQWDTDPESQERMKFLSREFEAFHHKFSFAGGFVESFMDWQFDLPAHSSKLGHSRTISHSGLYDTQRRAKHWLTDFTPFWTVKEYDLLPRPSTKRRTNFFSILIIFSTLIFFTVYRKHRRMNENLRKAVRHPYGFFVEMRERRIIPLFNSFWIGGYAALLMGSIFAEMIYYSHDSFLFQEILATLFGSLNIYSSILNICADPVWISVAMFLILFSYPILISFLLKLIALFTKEKIRYRQGLAIGLWSGVPLLFMLPLSLFGFQILQLGHYETIFLSLILLFIVWAHFRIINGIRVLFITGLGKVLGAMLLSYILPIVILWIVFKPSAYWFEYIELLYRARSLF